VDERLRPGLVWTGFLWLAAVAMGAVGAYQVVDQVQKVFK